jgi:trans-aconitate 2-methyltransferase
MADWDAEQYEQVSALQRTMAERSLAGLTPSGNERCLDLGCGAGYVTRKLARLLPKGSVLGVDASPRMIAAARSIPAPPGTTLNFEFADAGSLGYDDEFDLVVSFNALHWVPDQAAALAGIRRALRRPGRAVLRFVCSGPRQSIESVAMDVCADPRWADTFRAFQPPFLHVEPGAYRDLALASGFRIDSFEVEDQDWDFGSRQSLKDWAAAGFSDWTALLPSEEVPEWVTEVADRYAEVTHSSTVFRFYQLVTELNAESK